MKLSLPARPIAFRALSSPPSATSPAPAPTAANTPTSAAGGDRFIRRAEAATAVGSLPRFGGRTQNIAIIYGTETGNSEYLAEQTDQALLDSGLSGKNVYRFDMEDIKKQDLTYFDVILVITSTWGQGDPPANAEELWWELQQKPAVDLSGKKFSVLGLGDTSYGDDFCRTARDFDRFLEQLGAERLSPRVDCDLDYTKNFKRWLTQVLSALGA